MPIEPVKIPQNVYIEDRIVGPLTLRQIIISMLGLGLSYAIWASIAKVSGIVPLHITVIVWIPGALALVFAFVRVNDLSMTHLLFLFLERMSKPQTRIYGPRRGIAVNTHSFNPPPSTSRTVTANTHDAGAIGTLSDVLDRQDGGNALSEDIPEREDAVQGSSIPARPVQKGRITANPLASIESGTPVQSIFHDVVPPSSHV